MATQKKTDGFSWLDDVVVITGKKGKALKAAMLVISARILEQVMAAREAGESILGVAQFSVKGSAGWNDKHRGLITMIVDGAEYSVYQGDTHGLWLRHQRTAESARDWKKLFALLAAKPDVLVSFTLKG